VFNSQNIAKLVQSPLQPGFNSLAEVYMYVSFVSDHSTVLGPFIKTRMTVSSPRKIFEYSDAKSCILVTTCTWNFLLFENYDQEVGGPIHCWSPT